ncbi:MAG: hypothetical protein V7727_20155, partial [Sneathiella sp.]
MRNIVGEITDLFRQKFFARDGRTPKSDGEIQEIGRRIIRSLIDAEDVDIVAEIIRRHFFTYGLFGWSRREGSALFTKEQTIDLANEIVEREMPRLLKGELLKYIWDSDILYLLRDVPGELSEEARQYFDNLIQDDEALPAVSLFFNGPGYGVDAETLKKFFNLEVFRARVQEKLDQHAKDQIELDPSLQESYNKVINPLG